MVRSRWSNFLPGLLGPFLACALGGCGGGPKVSACELPTFDGRLSVPARDGMAVTYFDMDADATGGGDVRSLLIRHNRGQASYRGQLVDFLFHQRIEYPGTRLVYQGFGSVDGDGRDLHLMWIYCDGGRISALYYETTATAGHYVPVTGTCDDTANFLQQDVHLSALDLEVPRLTCGFSITSSDGSISLDGTGPGFMPDDHGVRRTALVFNMLDCREGCDAPSLGESWFELHVLLWDPNQPVLDYGILYLNSPTRATTGSHVLLDYGYNLTSVVPELRTSYDCDWSVQ